MVLTLNYQYKCAELHEHQEQPGRTGWMVLLLHYSSPRGYCFVWKKWGEVSTTALHFPFRFPLQQALRTDIAIGFAGAALKVAAAAASPFSSLQARNPKPKGPLHALFPTSLPHGIFPCHSIPPLLSPSTHPVNCCCIRSKQLCEGFLALAAARRLVEAGEFPTSCAMHFLLFIAPYI